MPELPEVETVRVELEPALVGRRFDRVHILDPRLVRPLDPAEVEEELLGEVVAAVERRGKYLVVRFESGRVLLVHLRMTGSFRYGGGRDAHRRAVVTLDNNSDVTYHDVRRFGTWVVLEPEEAATYLRQRLGDEPLERRFTTRTLGAALARRRSPVKAALLDQRVVAGLGNIYADEALWYARVHPLRPAADLSLDEVRRLHRGTRRALALGIQRHGATLRDYARPNGASGSMQAEFRVYGRVGEPCLRCGTPIEKLRVGGRGTSYCPKCQT